MKINKNLNSDSLIKFAFLLFGLIPLSSQKLEPKIAVLFILLIVIGLIVKIAKTITKNKKYFILNASLFLVLLITIIDEIDILTFKKLEQMFSLLIFPIVFFMLSQKGYEKNREFFNIWKKIF